MPSEYEVLSQLEHVLRRPEIYLGSTEMVTTTDYLYLGGRLIPTVVTYSPAVLKLFEELLANAIDDTRRDSGCRVVKVNIDAEMGEFSIYNDGNIPVRKQAIQNNKEDGENIEMYIPEIIFGVLNSGSNFDDSKQRLVAGQNGMGAKLANIFSRLFSIEVEDVTNGLKLQKTWRQNMQLADPTKVQRIRPGKKRGYVNIKCAPELARFGIEASQSTEWQNTCAVIHRKVIEAAMLTGKQVKVYYNGALLKVNGFKDYVKMITKEDTPLYGSFNDWNIAVAQRRPHHRDVSFVNGIETPEGGTHIDYVRGQLFDYISAKEKRCEGLTLKMFRDYFFVCVEAVVENPKFSSQSKVKLVTSSKSFKNIFSPKTSSSFKAFCQKVATSKIATNLIAACSEKAETAIQKADRRNNNQSKKKSLRHIEKLDDANFAGTTNAHKCILVLTEGDSAKTMVRSGLEKRDMDYFGTFPLKGKLINARMATEKQFHDNVEVQHIKQILGLEHGKKYESLKQLRYGKLLIAADADVDGIHIKALVLNMIQAQWPELISLGFVSALLTPVIKASHRTRKVAEEFYTEAEFEKWKAVTLPPTGSGEWFIKYYKGLGTSTTQEAKVLFKNYKDHVYTFTDVEELNGNTQSIQSGCATGGDNADAQTFGIQLGGGKSPKTRGERALDLAFSKENVGERRKWILQEQETRSGGIDYKGRTMIDIAIFVNRELIKYSIADTRRALPHVIDGLKTVQRKVIFTCLRRKLYDKRGDKAGIKLTQVAGAVIECAAYHHGDASLHSTITGLAQGFMGSNQMPLLEPIGQFGTRLHGGKDAASPRYISTYLSPLARDIFSMVDEQLLAYEEDDGKKVEPTFFVPILPMILLNGAVGIATGFSTFIPTFEIKGVLENVKRLLENRDADLEPMKVGFSGFRGSIEQLSPHSWLSRGVAELSQAGHRVHVTELPLYTWTTPYKQWLNSCEWIEDVVDRSSEADVDIVIIVSTPFQEESDMYRRLRLCTRISTANMNAFNTEGRIHKYESAEAILREFVECRLVFFQKRKSFIEEGIQHKLVICTNKMRFISEVVGGTLLVNTRKSKMVEHLKEKQYYSDSEKEKEGGDSGFSYLFSLPMHSLTTEYIEKLEREVQELKNELHYYSNSSEVDLYRSCLEALDL